MIPLGIGPKLYLAWCTRPPEGMLDRDASTVIENVCSVSELFDGDLSDMFLDDDGVLNKDVVLKGFSYSEIAGLIHEY